MASAANVRTLKVPIRFTRITVSNNPRSCVPFLPRMRAEGPMPAQLTTVRKGPFAAAALTAART